MAFRAFAFGWRPRLALGSLAICLLLSPAGAAPYDQDIAVYDRALAQLKEGERFVRFGDVGITPAQLRDFRERLVRAKTGASRNGGHAEPDFTTPGGTAFKWTSGVVYYRFDPTQVGNNTITAAKMQQFRDGVAEWAAWANLNFVESIVAQPNFITVAEDPSLGGGFSSSVGMAGGEQFVHLGPNAWNRGTVCHEVGHAIGLWHEQQRPDRDAYVIINFSNIAPGDQGNFAIIPDATTHGAYDFYSVMHYARRALAINPNIDTISMQPAYASFADIIGNVYDRTLSKLDRAGMGEVYGGPALAPSALVTNTKDGGPGSLRTAIYYAFDKSTDVVPVPTTIAFHIPTSDSGYNSATGIFTIKPTFLLTALGDGTTIDGGSQTGFGDTNPNGPEIALDGSSITALQATPFFQFAPGLSLRSANCTIKGLTITNFNQEGIRIAQGATGNVIGGTTAVERNVISGNAAHGIYIHDSTTTNNLIQGNYIGTDQTGAGAQGNSFAGIAIDKGAHGNTIGGLTAGTRNVISGNLNQGMLIGDAGSNANLVRGNYIGLNAAGTAAIPNAFSGIDIFGGAQSNTIGGTAAGARNVISGNNSAGIAITEFNDVTAIGSRNNLIQGNFIGVNAAGTTGVANQGAGVLIAGGAPSNTIGGTAAGAGNVISGNLFQGIAIGNAGTTNTLVQGNIVGLNAAGTGKIQNTGDGIGVYGGAQANTIGGTTAAARNLISGNLFSGVSISGNGTNNNLVQGNYIGLDVTGAIAQGNGGDGVAISGDFPAPSPTPAPAPNTGAQSNTIGGGAAGARNVISGNGGSGVTIGNPGDTGTNNNLVQGNYIGVDLNGSNAIANAGSGVALYGGAQFNTVGGTLVAARNIIAGNNGSGVNIGGIGYTLGQTFGPRQNLILGNYIGVDATGAARGNGSVGVGVFGSAQSNTIGGTAPGARNVISGNTFREVDISGANTTGNTFRGNLLGLDPSGVSTIVGTNTSGIGFADGAHGNTIGGTTGGSRNFICGHQNYGIYFADFGTTGNSVQGNTIGLNINGTSVPNSFPGIAFFNSAQANTIGGSAIGASNVIAGNANEGIAVYSFNTNPPTIKETFSLNSIFANGGKGIALYDGGNNSQPFPSLTSVALSTALNPNGTDVSGGFTGSASRIEFFASPTSDPSGFGEGQNFVGSISVGGAGPFTAHLSAVVPAGYAIAATATDALGNTSEFSQTFIVPSPGDNGADGLPDEWMLNHFGHTAPQSGDQSRAGDDPDGDGLTNLQEFRAGTDPRSATSALRIVAMARSGSDLNLTFASATGKTYRLEAKDDLLSANWNLLADQVFASGTSTQVIDGSAAGLPRRFYRVVIEP